MKLNIKHNQMCLYPIDLHPRGRPFNLVLLLQISSSIWLIYDSAISLACLYLNILGIIWSECPFQGLALEVCINQLEDTKDKQLCKVGQFLYLAPGYGCAGCLASDIQSVLHSPESVCPGCRQGKEEVIQRKWLLFKFIQGCLMGSQLS